VLSLADVLRDKVLRKSECIYDRCKHFASVFSLINIASSVFVSTPSREVEHESAAAARCVGLSYVMQARVAKMVTRRWRRWSRRAS
jgi:hypothetical protein